MSNSNSTTYLDVEVPCEPYAERIFDAVESCVKDVIISGHRLVVFKLEDRHKDVRNIIPISPTQGLVIGPVTRESRW